MGQSDSRIRFSLDGKSVGVWIQLDTGEQFLVQDHEGLPVTVKWMVHDLHEAVVVRTNMNFDFKLFYQGREGKADQTIEELMGRDVGEDETEICMHLRMEHQNFPRQMGPLIPLPLPTSLLPKLPEGITREELAKSGCKLQLSSETLRSFGFAGADEQGTVEWLTSPLVRLEVMKFPKWFFPEEGIDSLLHVYPSNIQGLRQVYMDVPLLRPEREAIVLYLLGGGFIFCADGGLRPVALKGYRPPSEHDGDRVALATRFSPPRAWKPAWTAEMARRGRVFQKASQAYREKGAMWVIWLMPGETVNRESLDVPHGGFAWLFHEDVVQTGREVKAQAERAFDRYFALIAPPDHPPSTADCKV